MVYLFVGEIAERLHVWGAWEALLAAWGFPANGKREFLGLARGTKVDTVSARDFLSDLN